MSVKDTAQAGGAAVRLTGTHQNYLQVAGTNIEDFERAMRSALTGSERHSAPSEQADPEVNA